MVEPERPWPGLVRPVELVEAVDAAVDGGVIDGFRGRRRDWCGRGWGRREPWSRLEAVVRRAAGRRSGCRRRWWSHRWIRWAGSARAERLVERVGAVVRRAHPAPIQHHNGFRVRGSGVVGAFTPYLLQTYHIRIRRGCCRGGILAPLTSPSPQAAYKPPTSRRKKFHFCGGLGKQGVATFPGCVASLRPCGGEFTECKGA